MPLLYAVTPAEKDRKTRSAFETLDLDRLDMVHAVAQGHAMAPGIGALPTFRLAAELLPLRK